MPVLVPFTQPLTLIFTANAKGRKTPGVGTKQTNRNHPQMVCWRNVMKVIDDTLQMTINQAVYKGGT